MNQSDLSEEFGQQIESLTTGTKYEIDSESDDEMDITERRIRAIMYNLWMDAQSKKLANYLKRKQDAHFAQLYEFSYGVSMYEEDYYLPKGTEKIALMIIDEKQAFIKRIERLYKRYERFERIAEGLDLSSKGVVVGYFKHGEKFYYELLRNTLSKHLNELEKVYKDDELLQETEADRLEDEYQACKGKEKYLIDRKYVYMTTDEYTTYLEKEKTERDKVYGRLGITMP